MAVLDRDNQPVERLSAYFGTREEALPYWLRTRHRRSSLVREFTLRLVEI